MQILVHVIILLAAIAIIWFFAGMILEAVSRVARRYCNTGFFTAFFLLGALTSISEISVAVNSSLARVPGVSVGNLIGASVVILLLIVPLLAVAGNKVTVNGAVTKRSLLYILAAIALPALLVIDGTVTKTEGLLALLAYATVAYSLFQNRVPIRACDVEEEQKRTSFQQLLTDLGRIVLGSAAIFVAAFFLVEEAVYFATLLTIPASLVGLIILSVGTNIPEIVIAIRSIAARREDIALGDYLGSASMNTTVFAFLALGSGTFFVEASEFIMSAIILLAGLVLFYFFVRSKDSLSKSEGLVLLGLYALFVGLQLFNVVRFA